MNKGSKMDSMRGNLKQELSLPSVPVLLRYHVLC